MSNRILIGSVARVKEILGQQLNDITIDRAVFGLFFSGVKLSTGQGGLCFTPIKDMPQAVCCPSSARAMPLSGKLQNRPATEYLDDIFGENVLKKTLGIATLNALSTLCCEIITPYRTSNGSATETLLSADAFDCIDFSRDKKYVVIGALAPMLKRLIKGEFDFTVLEMDGRTLKGEELKHFRPADCANEVVPSADTLIITGVTILNDTIDDLLKSAKPHAEILITGPTASMLPDVFFDSGVTLLGGIIVTKPDEALDIISEGGSGYHMFGKSAEQMVVRKI